MSRIKFKINVFLTLMSLSIMLISNTMVHASQNDLRHNRDTIDNLSDALECSIEYDMYKELLNGQENVVAIAYKVNTNGYVVIDMKYGDVVEYNFVENSAIHFDDDKKIYYGGPFSFYKEVSDSTCLDRNGELVKKSLVSFEAKRRVENTSGTMMISSYPDSGSLLYSTSKYSYNPDGRCGAVAAAIVLDYYDTYYNSGYIPTS